MIVKLICFIVCVVAFAFFIGLNLNNKCNIWLFFTTLENVPAFMNTLVSFLCGICFTIPFAFFFKFKKNKNEKSENQKKSLLSNKKPQVLHDKNEKPTSEN